MEASTVFILLVIFLALVFDFTNGFHDAANSIATIVTTGVLTPMQAVFWAAFFNFIAFLFFKLTVASTIGTGLVHPAIVSPYLIFAAITSAITWNMLTWYYGLPSSSSHALIGGLAGAAFAKGGMQALILSGFVKVITAIILSPLIGLLMGWGLTFLVAKLTKHNSESSNHRWFKRLQLISSAFLSMTHGGNDAQKTMGVIAVLLYSSSWLGAHFYVPFWVVISCYFVIALGTLAGGWRIVHTMGKKIAHLNTLRGCCAETSAALVIFAATDLGVPVSTTHTVTGSIAGVGLSQSFWGVQWQMMNKIFLTWVLTIPATALIAAGVMLVRFI
jgi:PiT family inorganic phosphate transporter